MTIVRTIRHLCLVAAIVVGGAAFLLPAGAVASVRTSSAATNAPPTATGVGSAPAGAIYDGVAAAASVHEQFDAIGGLAATVEPQYDNLPDALTVFNANTSIARASTYYPGATVTGAGLIVCGQVIEPNFPAPFTSVCPTPPYPLTAQAPTQKGAADASTPGSQHLTAGPEAVTAVAATAHADSRYVDATAADGAFTTAGAGAAGAAVLAFRQAVALATQGPVAAAAVRPAASDGSAVSDSTGSATSHQSFNPAGQLVATATSTVKGISLLGGAVKIASIVASSTYTADGARIKSHTQDVNVSGVTVGGMPATIDQNGITVNGAGTGKTAVDAVNTALQTLLTSTSSHIRLLAPTTSTKAGQVPAGLDSGALGAACTNGESDGVELYQQLDATQVPQGQRFFLSVTMGSACTDATVMLNPAGLAPGTGVAIPPLGALGGGVSSPSGGGGSFSGATGSTFGSPGASGGGTPLPAGPVAASVPLARGGGVLRRLEADLAGHGITGRVSLLYLAFVIAFVGLALGVIPLLSPRLPSQR
ncbi:MAG TPA: hypothetical protein VGI06_03635 [Acidimicrobiales bacterium]